MIALSNLSKNMQHVCQCAERIFWRMREILDECFHPRKRIEDDIVATDLAEVSDQLERWTNRRKELRERLDRNLVHLARQ